ncbi:hypothetical protein LLE49_08705 [Alicyclobacillus tolerans]|uniref:SpoIID/LytB domain-containing protein n=1 Tax=Alicyclobacillus tolerans TaxID=90970 RepID=UPI001F2E5AA2|nr:SpoIID/LytB domain-containing protein [Alicyclobacillus tolerans]MCF8564808.1 hypothetical protein [Alicyclobacillus tolerans]
MKRATLLASLIALTVWWTAPVARVQAQTIYTTKEPTVVRVAIRAYNNPRGSILWVQTVGFQEYCSDVLPNEWMPGWPVESLKAGAVAIKMFAWYHTLHPVTIDGFTFDVDNTTNFQEFKYMTGTPATNAVIREMWPYAFTTPNGDINQLDYRAGFPLSANWFFGGSQMMSQWGSQYLATQGWTYLRILNFYYPGKFLLYVP